jgi:hypothetical protein
LPGIVGAAFINDDFISNSVRVDCLFEEGGDGRRFITAYGKHEIKGVTSLSTARISKSIFPRF